jgi:hypothetical protein
MDEERIGGGLAVGPVGFGAGRRPLARLTGVYGGIILKWILKK